MRFPFASIENYKRQGLFGVGSNDNQASDALTQHLQGRVKPGVSLAAGDCFFDSVAQGLQSLGKGTYTAKGLRLLCHEYVVKLHEKSSAENWIYERFLANAKRLHPSNEDEARKSASNSYLDYMANIQYTLEDIEAGAGLNITSPIWGEQDIDGRILRELSEAKKLKFNLHVIEIHVYGDEIIIADQLNGRSVEATAINYQDKDTVHIAVFDNHFVPVLPNDFVLEQTANKNEVRPETSAVSNENLANSPKARKKPEIDLPKEAHNRRNEMLIPTQSQSSAFFASSVRQKAESTEGLSKECLCGLCEKELSESVVKAKYVNKHSVPEDKDRYYHEACLKDHLAQYVIIPGSNPSRQMKTAYQAVARTKLAENASCPLSKRKGQEIQEPVLAADGRIYEKANLDEYIKTADRLILDDIKVKNKLGELSSKERSSIHKSLEQAKTLIKAKATEASKTQQSSEINEADPIVVDILKAAAIVGNCFFKILKQRPEDQGNPLNIFLERIKAEPDLKFFDQNGQIVLGAYFINEERKKEHPKALSTRFFKGDKKAAIGAYIKDKNLIPAVFLGGAAIGGGLAIGGLAVAELPVVGVIMLPVGLILGSVPFLFTIAARYKSREFSEVLQIACHDFEVASKMLTNTAQERSKRDDKYKEIYAQLERFIEAKYPGQKLRNFIRWFATEYETYAFAHFLWAEVSVNLGKFEIAYEQYEKAYRSINSINRNLIKEEQCLKAVILLGLVKVLANPNITLPFLQKQREDLIEQKMELLKKDPIANEHIKKYSQYMFILFHNISCLISNGFSNFNEEILTVIKQFFSQTDLHLLQYYEPYGKYYEIALNFAQGLLIALADHYAQKKEIIDAISKCLNKEIDPNSPQSAPNKLALEYFKKCWRLVGKYDLLASTKQQLASNEVDYKKLLIAEIKDYITKFVKTQAKLSYDQPGNSQKLISVGELEEWRRLGIFKYHDDELSETEILALADQVSLASSKKLTTLTDVLNEIIQNPIFARAKLNEGETWLHILPKFPFRPELKTSVERATQCVLQAGVSPFAYNTECYTPYACIPPKDAYEFKKFLPAGDTFVGVDSQIATITNFFNTIKNNPNTMRHFLLLSGPPGVGKTELVKVLSKACGFEFNEYQRGTKEDKWRGQQEERVADEFKQAKELKKPICIFMDEIDATCPKEGRESKEDITSIFQEQISALKGTQVVVVGATNFRSKVKEAICNRAEVVEFTLPNQQQRRQIIENCLRGYRLEQGELLITTLAEATPGWSPRQLKVYIDGVIASVQTADSKFLPKLSFAAFEAKFETARQSFKQDYPNINIEPPKLRITVQDDVLAFDNKVQVQLDSVNYFLANPEAYIKRHPELRRQNTLLYGPPGTGKTSIAREIAAQSKALFICIDGGRFRDGPLAELQNIFNLAKRFDKAVLFIDEIDVLTSENAWARELIQTEMDGFVKSSGNILVIIGATNYRERIAEPVLSRFSNQVEVPLPTQEQRVKIFEYHLTKIKPTTKFGGILGFNLKRACERLAEASEGLSGRDIKGIILNELNLYVTRLQNDNRVMFTMEMLLERIRARVPAEPQSAAYIDMLPSFRA